MYISSNQSAAVEPLSNIWVCCCVMQCFLRCSSTFWRTSWFSVWNVDFCVFYCSSFFIVDLYSPILKNVSKLECHAVACGKYVISCFVAVYKKTRASSLIYMYLIAWFVYPPSCTSIRTFVKNYSWRECDPQMGAFAEDWFQL